MANNYTRIVGMTAIPCKAEDAAELFEALEMDTEEFKCHGITSRWYDSKTELVFNNDILEQHAGEMGKLHIFSGESGELDELSDTTLALIGRIITTANLPYWEFGIAWYCSADRPGQFGGSAARIYADGGIEYAEMIWPSEIKTEPT